MTIRRLLILALLCVALPFSVIAGEKKATVGDDAYAAAKSAELEALRARASASTKPIGGAALIEAEQALRRYRGASAKEKEAARAELDATMARLDLELSEANRFRP